MNLLNIARASGAEVAYLVHLTFELEMLSKDAFGILDQLCVLLVPQLEALVQSVEQLLAEERKTKRARVRRIRPGPSKVAPSLRPKA